MDEAYEQALRRAAMHWLDARSDLEQGFELFRRDDLLRGFAFDGRTVPLVSIRKGIWKPSVCGAALSILTTFTEPGKAPPYADTSEGPDGLPRYKYRGVDANLADNRALRAAMERRLPLIWFVAVAKGRYEAIRPVWLIDEEREQRQFVVAVDAAQRALRPGQVDRAYAERLTKQRVHQRLFRAQVIPAYGYACAMCRLRYVSLLDAAHILPDGHPRGDPVVTNGLSLCKIHHAAFDQNLIGVRPDTLAVEVRGDVREEHDGPMLRYGLQEMQGVQLHLPGSRRARPDRSRLAERWAEFRRAG